MATIIIKEKKTVLWNQFQGFIKLINVNFLVKVPVLSVTANGGPAFFHLFILCFLCSKLVSLLHVFFFSIC